MTSKYEFKMIINCVTLPTSVEATDFSKPLAQSQLADGLSDAREKLSEHFSEIVKGEDWEINSHGLDIVGNVVIVSVLAQQARPQT